MVKLPHQCSLQSLTTAFPSSLLCTRKNHITCKQIINRWTQRCDFLNSNHLKFYFSFFRENTVLEIHGENSIVFYQPFKAVLIPKKCEQSTREKKIKKKNKKKMKNIFKIDKLYLIYYFKFILFYLFELFYVRIK